MVRIHNRILLSHEKEWNNVICSNMDEPRDYHPKWSKPDRERQMTYEYHLCVESKTWHKWTYLQTETDSQTYRTDLCLLRRGGEGRIDWEFGISRFKLSMYRMDKQQVPTV